METLYITSAAKAQQLPKESLPEIAMVGRSNCGKSSLINTLLQHKIARVSGRPGNTQMINFLVNKALYVVDLPGYGFSKNEHETRANWQSLVKTYFERGALAQILFLMDIRRDLQADDIELMRFLTTKQLVVVLTKADKVGKNDYKKRVDLMTQSLIKNKVNAAHIVVVSSLKKQGLDELRKMCGLDSFEVEYPV